MGKCIIVSGFHRSGTSMTMQALQKAGVFVGNSLIGPNAYNVDGHFEHQQIVQLHDELLSEIGSDWLAINLQLRHEPVFTQEAKSKAKTIIAGLGHQPVWGFKDPRASLFLWDWQQQIPDLFVVVVYRHYLSCIQSLRIRAAQEIALSPSSDNAEGRLWIDATVGLKSWITYNNRLINYCIANPDSTMLLQQESIMNGFPLISTLNTRANINLNDKADTGISPSKSTRSLKLPFPSKQIGSELIDQADNTWAALKRLSRSHVNQQSPVALKEMTMPDNIQAIVEKRLSTISFSNVKEPVASNAQRPIKLGKPLQDYSTEEVKAYRPRLRASLELEMPSPVSALITEYEQSSDKTYFGEMLLAEKAIIHKQFNKAKKILDDAKNLEPKDGMEPYLKGCVEEQAGNNEKAFGLYETATTLLSGNVSFWIAQIRTLRNLGESRKALKVVESALSVSGRNLQLEVNKALLLDELNEFAQAIDTLERALAQWPEHLHLLSTLYHFTNKSGNSAEAERYYKEFASKKIKANPQYTSDILQLFRSIKFDSDKGSLWNLIDSHFKSVDI